MITFDVDFPSQPHLMRFEDFQVGDVATLERVFTRDDFEQFAALSGDTNALHSDSSYAQSTPFGRPIVPLHLTLAPLSMFAGMIFPGQPSLYLAHQARAAHEVFYGDLLRYSTRIESINQSHRILMLRVLVSRGHDVVLEANMQVQCMSAEWMIPTVPQILRTSTPATVLITGSTGEIGQAIAATLAQKGHKLLLHDRKACDTRRDSLRRTLDLMNCTYAFIDADLSTTQGIESLCCAALQNSDVDTVVHTASSRITDGIHELVSTNYLAAKSLTEAFVPNMLMRQRGRFVFIGSSVTISGVPGWEHYAAAKTMTTGLMIDLDRRFSSYGIRSMCLLPGMVATQFSEKYRATQDVLIPEEVAHCVASMLENPSHPVVVLNPNSQRNGVLGFLETRPDRAVDGHDKTANTPKTRNLRQRRNRRTAKRKTTSSVIEEIIRAKFNVAPAIDIRTTGLGITPGWDSLAQIELVLQLEATFEMRFQSDDLSNLTTFVAIEKTMQSRDFNG